MNCGGDSGIIVAIQRGQMKEVSLKTYTNMQVSGNFKSWAKDMNDYLCWHGRSIKDQKLSYEAIEKCCYNRKVHVDVSLRTAHGDRSIVGRRAQDAGRHG